MCDRPILYLIISVSWQSIFGCKSWFWGMISHWHWLHRVRSRGWSILHVLVDSASLHGHHTYSEPREIHDFCWVAWLPGLGMASRWLAFVWLKLWTKYTLLNEMNAVLAHGEFLGFWWRLSSLLPLCLFLLLFRVIVMFIYFYFCKMKFYSWIGIAPYVFLRCVCRFTCVNSTRMIRIDLEPLGSP